MDPPEIEFVYFDLGNVLLSFDPSLACRNLAETFSVDVESVRQVVYESGLQDRFEHGAISGEQFVEGIRDRLGLSLQQMPTGQVLDGVSDMFTPIDSMASVLQMVRNGDFGVGLLSNTCHAHWDWIGRQPYFVNDFSFDVTILSYELGSMKPDGAIYGVAEKESGVDPSRLLFLDDKLENVDAARSRGWHAVQCMGGASAIQALKDYRVLGSSH